MTATLHGILQNTEKKEHAISDSAFQSGKEHNVFSYKTGKYTESEQ